MEDIFNAIFGFQGESDKIQLVKLAKLPRIIRLFGLTKVFKFLRYFLQTDLLMVFKFNAGIMKLLSMFLTFALMIHLMSCVWAYLAVIESDQPVTWMSRYGIDQDQPISKYIASVYFTLTVVTTVGYGDISAATTSKNNKQKYKQLR